MGEFTVANISGGLGSQCNTKVMAFLKKEGKKTTKKLLPLCGVKLLQLAAQVWGNKAWVLVALLD